MQYFIFKTRSKTLYLPDVKKEYRFLWALYTPYSFLTCIYWTLWKQIKYFRKQQTCYLEELPTDYKQVFSLIGKDNLLSFNSGSRGEEQKISVLAFNPQKQQKQFAKLSYKTKAQQLSLNEIQILEKYGDNKLIPKLISKKISPNFVFFTTSYVEGRQRKQTQLNENILNLLFTVAQKDTFEKEAVLYSFAHGDFCPWNILEQNNKLKLIDWEMAGEYPLGYDLFTYIFQTHFILRPKKSIKEIIDNNKKWIDKYFINFNIKQWNTYLLKFCQLKIKSEKTKKESTLQFKLRELEIYLT